MPPKEAKASAATVAVLGILVTVLCTCKHLFTLLILVKLQQFNGGLWNGLFNGQFARSISEPDLEVWWDFKILSLSRNIYLKSDKHIVIEKFKI